MNEEYEFKSPYGCPFKRADSEQEFFEKNFKNTKHEDWANKVIGHCQSSGKPITNSQWEYLIDCCL